uniref:Putative ovule protein n=1 Tax=Solanum chacoense TaxID=4108 RepID=A0A0V0GRD1_SOLCH
MHSLSVTQSVFTAATPYTPPNLHLFQFHAISSSLKPPCDTTLNALVAAHMDVVEFIQSGIISMPPPSPTAGNWGVLRRRKKKWRRRQVGGGTTGGVCGDWCRLEGVSDVEESTRFIVALLIASFP